MDDNLKQHYKTLRLDERASINEVVLAFDVLTAHEKDIDKLKEYRTAFEAIMYFMAPQLFEGNNDPIELTPEEAQEIVDKETQVKDLKRKYFGNDGELYKKRESLMKPIQEEIYNAIKDIAEAKDYMRVDDRASSPSILFANPAVDISDEVLTKLGYAK